MGVEEPSAELQKPAGIPYCQKLLLWLASPSLAVNVAPLLGLRISALEM